MIRIYHIFFIHSFVDEHLGCFHPILTGVNNVTMNLGVQISFQDPDFIPLDIYLELELLGLMVKIKF